MKNPIDIAVGLVLKELRTEHKTTIRLVSSKLKIKNYSMIETGASRLAPSKAIDLLLINCFKTLKLGKLCAVLAWSDYTGKKNKTELGSIEFPEYAHQLIVDIYKNFDYSKNEFKVPPSHYTQELKVFLIKEFDNLHYKKTTRYNNVLNNIVRSCPKEIKSHVENYIVNPIRQDIDLLSSLERGMFEQIKTARDDARKLVDYHIGDDGIMNLEKLKTISGFDEVKITNLRAVISRFQNLGDERMFNFFSDYMYLLTKKEFNSFQMLIYSNDQNELSIIQTNVLTFKKNLEAYLLALNIESTQIDLIIRKIQFKVFNFASLYEKIEPEIPGVFVENHESLIGFYEFWSYDYLNINNETETLSSIFYPRESQTVLNLSEKDTQSQYTESEVEQVYYLDELLLSENKIDIMDKIFEEILNMSFAL